MLHLKLYREENTSTYCRGQLYADFDADDDDDDDILNRFAADYGPGDDSADISRFGQCFLCDTIEPPVRHPDDFIRGKTAIRAGLYRLALTPSPRFGRQLPLLVGVPGMTGIRIHRGNTAADTRGCILPGRYVGNGRVVNSALAELDIIRLITESPSPADILVVNNFGQRVLSRANDPDRDDAVDDPFRTPSLSSWPLADLIERSVWDRLRTFTPAHS